MNSRVGIVATVFVALTISGCAAQPTVEEREAAFLDELGNISDSMTLVIEDDPSVVLGIGYEICDEFEAGRTREQQIDTFGDYVQTLPATEENTEMFINLASIVDAADKHLC